MRQLEQGTVLAVRAIGGLHVVTLAWDFVAGQEAKREGLLGFAIERSEFDEHGNVIERYFLRGIKRFKLKDEGVAPGTPLPTSEHPIQSFQWGDYTVKPKTTYRYRVVPIYGKPKLLELDDNSSVTVEITTEKELGQAGQNGQPTHDIFFNRGAAGSQAYARKFPDTQPNEKKPDSEQMKWLSRGLFEALINFIRLAAGNDAQDYKLRAMLYEFRYLPVGLAFKEARSAGADVAIRYEAQSYKAHNEEMIAKAHIKNICKPQKSRNGIRHNKFIVLIHNDTPVAVWTGSTNISAGGIFGHSNVGHTIWDETIAQRFLDYWERLADADVTRGPLVEANLEVETTPEPNTLPPNDRMLTLLSPRDEPETVETLHWYANLMGATKRVMCMTFAFNLDDFFRDELLRVDDALRYAVFDKTLDEDVEEQINQVRNTVIASGAKLSKNDLENFVGERLTGFNSNYYIHDKFLLIDPLGDDSIVVTGTANFSRPSQHANDENMIVIRGSQRVADIYFGEFMRIFDHLYSRYIVGKMKKLGLNNPDAGFLKEDPEQWVPDHFKPGRKQLRRQYFMGA
ncbi:MAG TPA: phospholipase D-like domain-containing protein [Pyrinomonadaceae bacterium]|jgi:phosphatidylserine/phosphatidylglycerophosphate/cardiolipin synthase-like enzyme|nr:phospholipase D-like domain-containing protein [Pyrinomonadaceae bacterium]